MKFAKVLRTPFFTEHLRWWLLLLEYWKEIMFFVVHVVLDLTLQTTLREHPASAVAEKLRIF